MTKRTTKPADISAESLRLDVAPTAARPTAVISDELHDVPEAAEITRPEPVQPAAPAAHADIGLWEAIYWKSVPMWKHKTTGRTTFKREEAQRLRNLK